MGAGDAVAKTLALISRHIDVKTSSLIVARIACTSIRKGVFASASKTIGKLPVEAHITITTRG